MVLVLLLQRLRLLRLPLPLVRLCLLRVSLLQVRQLQPLQLVPSKEGERGEGKRKIRGKGKKICGDKKRAYTSLAVVEAALKQYGGVDRQLPAPSSSFKALRIDAQRL